MNFGYSSRLPYDDCAYNYYVQKSTNPLIYRMNTNKIFNGSQFCSTFGPRPGYMGNGVSTLADSTYFEPGHPPATANYLVDVESILTNRNMHTSKCKNGNVNPANLIKLSRTKYNHHLPTDNKFLDPVATHLIIPPIKSREAPIDRFYELTTDPQKPIFWNFAVNTDLEAKDNFKFKNVKINRYDPMMPSTY